MKSRERALRSINHKQIDRPPIFASVTHQVGDKLDQMLGISPEKPVDSFFSARISYSNVLLELGNDCVCVAIERPENFTPETSIDGGLTDEWGITWSYTGLYSEMTNHPLKEADSINDLDNYSFPSGLENARFNHARSQISKYRSDCAIIGEQECTVFELSWYLTGLEKFLVDLMMERPYIFELMDRVMEINLNQAVKLAELGADIIWTGDDIGNQSGMMMSPDLWRQHLKPRMQHVFATLKKVNPDLKLAYHSCGSILPVIPDLVEIGLDILNPLQPRAAGMDATMLKNTYGKNLSFFGGIDIQDVLPFGSPDDVRKHVLEKKSILGKNGGYILAPAHNIQPDTPVENILAFYAAAKEKT